MFIFEDKITQVRQFFEVCQQKLADPQIIQDTDKLVTISREHNYFESILECYNELIECTKQLDENKQLLEEEKEEDFLVILKEEISELKTRAEGLESKLKILIVPPEKTDSRNSIIEIRSAAGGDEAGIFAADMFRMYLAYAEQKKWKTETIEHTSNDVGGLKLAVFTVKGDGVFRELCYESGVHRVQRIPKTESQGRIHTSTITVAVLPEAEEVDDIEIKNEDLRIDTFRASGAGGQHVNTTDSAVRITHIPTGTVVACQMERSQHRNKDMALQLLKSRILEEEIRKKHTEDSEHRSSQIGTGDRSERIRTYNYPQNRITDHRYGINLYDLPNVIAGDMSELIQNILTIEAEKKLHKELKR